MIQMQPAQTLPDGTVVYPDDSSALRWVVLPTGIELARDPDGRARFNCIFYQTDFPERGARLVLALQPVYPAVDQQVVEQFLPSGARVDPLPLEAAVAQIDWPFPGPTAAPVVRWEAGLLHIEAGLTVAEAIQLRALFSAGAESGRVQARFAYRYAIPPVDAAAWLDIEQAIQHLAAAGQTQYTGSELRAAIAGLPEPVLRLTSHASGAPAAARDEILAHHASTLVLPLAAIAADPVADGLILDDRVFCLRAPGQFSSLQVRVDLARPRAGQAAWVAEWSLADFHAQSAARGELDRYFPEVRHVPVVGQAQVLVENLLTATPDALQEVRVELKHRVLGSLEEQLVRFRFQSGSPPVASHSIPVIAFTPFAYQYRVQLLLAGDAPSSPPETIPPAPQWQTSDQPVLEIGHALVPYAQVYLSVEPELFRYARKAVIEIAAWSSPPEPLASVALTGEQRACWLLIRRLAAGTREFQWRARYTPLDAREEQEVTGPWHRETRPQAVLPASEIIPREPVPVQVTVQKGDTPEITRVLLELRGTPAGSQQMHMAFAGDAQRVVHFWPETIFETGCQYRFGVVPAGATTRWLDWQPVQGGEITMRVEDEFYSQRTILVDLIAPWAAQRSPDPTTRKGEIIFAQVELNTLHTASTQSTSFTFDADTPNARFAWNIRGLPGAEAYQYRVHLLALDGRMIDAGPFQSQRETLSLEVIRKSVHDTAPPEFLVRERLSA